MSTENKLENIKERNFVSKNILSAGEKEEKKEQKKERRAERRAEKSRRTNRNGRMAPPYEFTTVV